MNKYLLMCFLPVILLGCGDITKLNTKQGVYYLNGYIDEDTYLNFKQNVDNYKVTTVVLDSMGGSVIYGIKIGEIVSKHKLTTIVKNNTLCASSCTYIFVSGEKKLLRGWLGIHSPAYKGVGYENCSKDCKKRLDNIKQDLIQYVTRFGIKAEFIEDSYKIPNSKLKYLNHYQFKKYLNKGE